MWPAVPRVPRRRSWRAASGPRPPTRRSGSQGRRATSAARSVPVMHPWASVRVAAPPKGPCRRRPNHRRACRQRWRQCWRPSRSPAVSSWVSVAGRQLSALGRSPWDHRLQQQPLGLPGDGRVTASAGGAVGGCRPGPDPSPRAVWAHGQGHHCGHQSCGRCARPGLVESGATRHPSPRVPKERSPPSGPRLD